jgi:hypothetical protein
MMPGDGGISYRCNHSGSVPARTPRCRSGRCPRLAIRGVADLQLTAAGLQVSSNTIVTTTSVSALYYQAASVLLATGNGALPFGPPKRLTIGSRTTAPNQEGRRGSR